MLQCSSHAEGESNAMNPSTLSSGFMDMRSAKTLKLSLPSTMSGEPSDLFSIIRGHSVDMGRNVILMKRNVHGMHHFSSARRCQYPRRR